MTVRVCLSTANTLTYPQGGHLWVFINWALGFKASGCEVVWLDVAPPTMSSTELSERLLTLKTLLRPFGLDHIAVDYLTENDCSVALQREGLPAISDFGVFDLLFDLRYNLPSRIALQAKRSVLLDIDPGQLQLALAGGHYPAPKHNCFFTIGQSLAGSEAGLPTGKGKWLHTNPCVYLPEWPKCATGREAAWTTISHWWGDYM
jgi:hypothetical protein